MTCIMEGAILGRFETDSSHKVTVDLDTKLEYRAEDHLSLRGKFFVILLIWNPLQALGNIVLRLYYIFTGTWAHRGELEATEAHLTEMKTDFSLRGKVVSSNKILSYQLIELAKEVSKLVLFVVFGIALREIVALFGVVFPLDARALYAKVERLFFVYPKDRINTKADGLEYFSFSAPCMQPDSPEMKVDGRRCDSCCRSEDQIYQPNLVIVKLKVLKEKIMRAQELCLMSDEAQFFENLHATLKEEDIELNLSTRQEVEIGNGGTPTTPKEKQYAAIFSLAKRAIEQLEAHIKAWSLSETHSFEPFIEEVQQIYPDSDSV